MVLNCEKYVGPCVCGRTHTVETKKIVAKAGALAEFEQYMQDVGLSGLKRTVLYDSTVYELMEGKHIRADQEIVLEAKGLRAEDVLIEEVMKKLEDPEVIVVCGGGTIQEYARYSAFKLGIPFAAVPTVASSDGFTSNTCSAIIGGLKKSTPMIAPTLIVADLDIIATAPARLIASGINDVLAKYISISDWKIAHLVSGEYYCPVVEQLAEEAVHIMRFAAEQYAETGVMDHAAMIIALAKSGMTTQLMNQSRAASGAEHLMAHLIDMKLWGLEKAEGYHGECVGVGTYLCIKKYHEIAACPKPSAKPYKHYDEELVRLVFGERLAGAIIKENAGDVLATFDPQIIVDKWDDILAVIASIPSAEEMETLFKGCNCKYLPEHIGISPQASVHILPIASAIRNRLTFLRMLRVLDFETK